MYFKFKSSFALKKMKINHRRCHNAQFRILKLIFCGKSVSNPEFKNNHENFHPCNTDSTKCHKGVLNMKMNFLSPASKIFSRIMSVFFFNVKVKF